MSLFDFINYCHDFYGENGIYDLGMTKEELWKGLELRLRNHSETPFDGDTVDRELVRDEVLSLRKSEVTA